MATLRRGLVDTVKKAAAKVSTRGVQVAAKAGTRGARALVETTAAAVKTVDKLQAKLGRRGRKPSSATTTTTTAAEPMMGERSSGAATQATPRTAAPKPRRASAQRTPEALPVELREGGRKTMPAAAPKRSKRAKAAGKQFKVKRGQKHLHSGR